MNLLLPTTVTSLVVTGFGVAVLGSIKVPLARRLAIDEARVGGMVSLFGFIMVPVIFTSGFLTDQFGKQAVLIGGNILMAISLALLARALAYSTALIGVILASAGWAAMANANNALIPLAFPGNLGNANNLANVFFGAGAFLTPLCVAALLRRTTFTTSLTILAVAVAAPTLLALGADFTGPPRAPADAATGDGGSIGLADLLGDPILWLCGLSLFFYAPLEACTGAWATTYLGEKGLGEQAASNLLSGFWLAFMAARLVTALTLPPGHEATLIVAAAFSSALVLAGVVATRTKGQAAAMMIAAGLVYGPVFPTLMAVLLGHFDASVHGRAVGLLFAIGGVGWTVTPIVLGSYARRTSVQRGFAVALASAIGLVLVAFALAQRVT